MRKAWWIVLVLIGCTALVAVADTSEDDDPASISERLDTLFFEWDRLDRPGGSVAVIKDGTVVFQKGFGLSSLEHLTGNTIKTIYDVTSLAEPFTALAIAELESQGLLSLDDKVRDYLPNLAEGTSSITVRHLLHHTSGLWDWQTVHQLSGHYLEDVITSRQIMNQIRQQHLLEFTPGSTFQYSCTNYTLLVKVIEQVTGLTFRDWTWEHILRPNKMTSSVVRDRHGEPIEGCATAYDYHPRTGYQKGADNLSAPGAHCFFTSVDNLAKWLIKLEAPTTVDQALRQKLLTPGTLDDGEVIEYGYGLYKDTFNGLTRYRTSGQWQGFNSVFHYYPDQNFGVFILCNWISGWVNPVYQATAIADIYLADEFKESDTAAPTDESSEFQSDPALYEQYVGDYRWEPGELFAIVQDQDRLAYQMSPTMKFPMTEVSPGRFVLDGYFYYFTFQQNNSGEYTQCLIEFAGSDDVLAPKITLVTPTEQELKQFTGDYYSQELTTLYTVTLEDGVLSITHGRIAPTLLTPETKNHFTANSTLYRLVEFTEDDQDNVTGFKLDPLNVVFRRTD